MLIQSDGKLFITVISRATIFPRAKDSCDVSSEYL